MVEIIVAGTQVRLEDVNEGWLAHQVGRPRRDGIPVCVQVRISEPDVNVALATPACVGASVAAAFRTHVRPA